MGNSNKTYLVFTEESLIISGPKAPSMPFAILEAYSLNEAKALLYIACHDGELPEIDIDSVRFLDISNIYRASSYANNWNQSFFGGQGEVSGGKVLPFIRPNRNDRGLKALRPE